MERFKTVDTGFGYRPTKANHIVDSIHFVKSNNNHLIQLADVVAYILLRGKRINDELQAAYINQKSTFSFANWVNDNANPRQKTELHHENLLRSLVLFFKEFP